MVMPQLKTIDSTLHFLRDPYRFISSGAKSLGSDVFETRIMLKKTICMTGKDAAKLFSDEDLFERKGAQPEPVAATLLGKGGVQGLDREAHLDRKQLFMSFTSPEFLTELLAMYKDWLDVYAEKWVGHETIPLFEQFQEILSRTVHMWAGIELAEDEVSDRTRDLSRLFDSAARSTHLLARKSRIKTEQLMKDLVLEIRNEQHPHLAGRPVDIIARFRTSRGELLSADVAAVEILNLLRPMIAVSVYLVFCLHALTLNKDSRQRLKAQEPGFLDNFVNEVRRFYPFFPAINAKVKQDFQWGKLHFKKGRRVMLDLYGINHDPRLWTRPHEFRPDRFNDWNASLFTFVPQGVGDHYVNHRCPGEIFTIELMRLTVNYFVSAINFEVPSQNLVIDMKRLPALPADHFLISNVSKQFSAEGLASHV